MQYFGGKSRLAVDIASQINKLIAPRQTFVDMFCGSCNVISQVDNNRVRIANDKHPYLIAMFKALQEGWIPPDEISKDQYFHTKQNQETMPHLAGFVGFGCSYAGKWWGGYAYDNVEKKNYAAIAQRSLLRKIKLLGDVKFSSKDYTEMEIPDNSFIYCDIPYKNTTQYNKKILGVFDHYAFHIWVRSLIDKGHTVYISEYKYNLPHDAVMVWEKSSIKKIRDRNNIPTETTEVLYTLKQ